MEKKENGEVSLSELIDVLIEADRLLEQKISEVLHEIPIVEELISFEKEQYQSKVPSKSLEEQRTTFICIQIIEARDLDALSDDLHRLRVRVSVQNDERFQTTGVLGSPKPFWDEGFKL